jgi:long-chain acyl-CoA synthetase
MPNLANHLFRQANTQPDKIALIWQDENISFGALANRVLEMAGRLAAAGVSSGTHVGLMMPTCPAFITVQQALFARGAIFTPLNIFYKPGELAHVIESCDLEWLIIPDEYRDKVPTGTSLKGTICVENLPDAAPLTGIADQPATATGMMLNTSATTGKSKGVMLSLANIAANYDRTPEWLGLSAQTITLCALPLYNTFGLNQCINALMVTGGSMVLMPRFDALACLEAIARHHCTFFPAVPTMLQKLFDHPDAAAHDLSSVTHIMTGGAPVPAALLERVHAAMGANTAVLTGYGLTEGTAIATLERIELDASGALKRPKSIGKLLPGIEARIMKDDGSEAAPGEAGEICLRGPGIMLGYYKQPEETAKAIVDGWLHTGDIGLFDADGYGSIVDRKKDVIIRGGQNIYPADIEEVLYGVPGVAEVAVIGVSDPVMGEVPVAHVALLETAQVTEIELLAQCREQLASFKIPVSIYFHSELPKGPTGKILRRGLREFACAIPLSE